MKKWKLSLYVYLGCFALKLFSRVGGVFATSDSISDSYYQPSVPVKIISVACTTLIDSLVIAPIALLIYYLLGEKNEYRTLITLLGSWAIYDVMFHIMYYISN